jgi:2-desacetyl-2-hydroxyethyl bacteriochlorophyllide A dehydrogenase
MKAVRGAGDGVVDVVEVDEPDGPGEVITIRSASICGSDFMYLRAGSRYVMGHELAGFTDAGDPVAVEAIFGCMDCDVCRSGRYNLCPRVAEAVPGLSVDGGMSERFRVPADRLVPLPPGLDIRDASLVEPASVSWHGVRLGGVDAGRRVAVVGGGAVGLLAVAAARAFGAEDVALEARHRNQIEAGERLGAVQVRGLYDVVVEAAGSLSAVARSVELAAPGGTVVVLGVHMAGFELPFLPLFTKEVRVVPSMAYSGDGHGRDVDEAAALLASDPEIAATLITHRFSLDEAPQAFGMANSRTGAIKVVVEP